MFASWSNFYIMFGGTSAGLIGLLFIVVTLSAASEATRGSDDLTRGHSVYASPTVFHLAVILLVSASALVPNLPRTLSAFVLFSCGVSGLIYIGWVISRFKSRNRPPGFEKVDLWLYGVAPACTYIALLTSGILIVLRKPYAAHFLGFTIICLLLIAVNNAWDLAGWLAHPVRKRTRRTQADHD